MKQTLICVTILGLCLSLTFSGTTVHAQTFRKGFTSSRLDASLKKRITGTSYPSKRTKAAISYDDLRYLHVLYVDFQGKTQTGELIVNKKIASKTLKIFYQLYQMGYPIQRMSLVDDYNGKDEASMSANNTSAFNYRLVTGSSRLSKHGQGLAIDINPRINPCISYRNGKVSLIEPSNGRAYIQRSKKKCKGIYARYMIHKNDKVYKLFKKYGFSWGGDWNSKKDYQHFEYTGNQ